MSHAFNPSTGEGGNRVRQRISLVFRASSRTAKAMQRNPVSKNKQAKNIYMCIHIIYIYIYIHAQGGWCITDQLWLHGEFEINLDYMPI